MNSESPLRPSPRRLLRESLGDHAAALEVLAVGVGCAGAFVVRAALEAHEPRLALIGLLCVAMAGAFDCVSEEADAFPRRPGALARAGEIGRMTDEEFDLLLDEVERQARMPCPCPCPVAGAVVTDDDPFAQLVRDALDELPEFVQDELSRGNLAVAISDYGCEWNAFGVYSGGTAASDDHSHRITIFRDTLTACFGGDAEELRRQVAITVRHEVAHHFGADERRVRELGL